jgi:F-type H+-transporting ATPase subunit b
MNYEEIAKWSDVISWAIFMGVIVWLWIKYVQPAVNAAQRKSNEQIAAAERYRDEAKAAIETLHGTIAEAEADAERIRERGRSQGQHEAETIVEEAKTGGERTLRNAQGQLERSRTAARAGLRAQFASKALDLARKQAADKVDVGLNNKLVQAFVASIERRGAN